MNDDPFFQPKDIEKREEERKEKIKERRREIVSKIKLGLKNIRENYENKNWDSKGEELFLRLFFKLHINEIYDKKYDGYFLLNENNKQRCLFDLKYKFFFISYQYIWSFFDKEFHWSSHENESFIRDMLNKHFKLNEFEPIWEFSLGSHNLG